MTATIGELCAGYGGLGMGVSRVIDAEVAWYSEIDKGALKVLEHRFPGVPNIGDMTTVDWASVPRVDILTGGTPCQDLSHAGKRAGMTEGTRSNLWVAMREAIAVLRPSLVVWENVGGAYSAEADSDMERREGRLGGRPRRPALRALGRVLGDLATLGYVGGWHGLRAADVGAPHGRLRVFVVAYPEGDARWFQHRDGGATRDAACRREWSSLGSGRSQGQPERQIGGADRSTPLLPTPAAYDGDRGGPQHPDKRLAGGHSVTLQDAVHGLLPTPRATDGTKGGPSQRGSSGDLMLPSAVTLLLTPAVNDMGAAYTPETWDAWTERMKAEHGNGNGHGKSLNIEAQKLLPTPTMVDHKASGGGYNGQTNVTLTDATARQPDRWGDYADAIARWEHLTRPAPEPTMLSRKGTPQLSPAFSEWMMGLPAGWVTDVPGITRNAALRALGNGVVPQQAEAALRFLLPALSGAAA